MAGVAKGCLRRFYELLLVCLVVLSCCTGTAKAGSDDQDAVNVQFLYLKAKRGDLIDFKNRRSEIWKSKEFERAEFSRDPLTRFLLENRVFSSRFLAVTLESDVEVTSVSILDSDNRAITSFRNWQPGSAFIICTSLREYGALTPQKVSPSELLLVLQDGQEHRFSIELKASNFVGVGPRDEFIGFGNAPRTNQD